MRAMTFLEKLNFVLSGRKLAKQFSIVQYKSKEEIRRIQNFRFVRLLKHAYETVPFYRNKFKRAGVLINCIKSIDDIKELPIVEKSELIANFPDDVLSTQFRDQRKLYMFVTGGTSGQTLKIFHTPQSIHATLASYHRAYADIMGGKYKRSDVAAYVYTSPYPFNNIFGAYKQEFLWTLDSTEQIREKLLCTQPHLLACYPSTLDRITNELSAKDRVKISARLKAISLNSEMSSQSQRDIWEEQWKVPVRDEFCSEEVSTIIFHQCLHKNYHTHNDTCVLESVNDHGQICAAGSEGNLVVTALYNYAMPIIRYNQQDKLTLDDSCKTCQCRSNFTQVASFSGRINDAFSLPSGRILSSGYLLDVGYSTLLKYSDIIRYWSLIQENLHTVVLECVLVKEVSNSLIESIKSDLTKLFYSEVQVSIRLVNNISCTSGGKRKQIRSMINESIDSIHSTRGEPTLAHYKAA